ncbi:unnamed protein product [Bathycoccus prasinos]
MTMTTTIRTFAI